MKNRQLLPLQQHPHFTAALCLIGGRAGAQHLPSGAVVQVVTRFGLRAGLRGPVWPAHTGLAAQIRDLAQARLHLINAEHPDPALRRAGFAQTHTGAHVAELALDSNITAHLHPKWRASWHKSFTADLQITVARWDSTRHGWLLRADTAQQRRAGFRALPHALIAAYGAQAAGAACVYTAHLRGDAVAAMVFLHHAPCVSYHLGWSGPAGRAVCAHHGLLIRAAGDFAARGALRLDLGLVDTCTTPGLARFKIGTGAQIRQLGGTWLRIPRLRARVSHLATCAKDR